MRTPAEWREIQASMRQEQLRRLEAQVDMMIDACSYGSVRVYIEPMFSNDALDAAVAAYEKAGWDVRIEERDQTDQMGRPTGRNRFLVLNVPAGGSHG
jgi:xanthine/CO dehydrogenase XdhC/CoxF family maturation factor